MIIYTTIPCHLYVVRTNQSIVLACIMYGKYAQEMKDLKDADLILNLDSKTWGLAFICIFTSLFVAAFWLQMIKSFATCLIWFTLSLSVIACLIFAGVFLSMGTPPYPPSAIHSFILVISGQCLPPSI